jgi:hypothetical protein
MSTIKAQTLVESQVFDIDYGRSPNEDHLILLSNGLVVKVAPQDSHLLPKSNKLGNISTFYRFVLKKNRYIKELNSFEKLERSFFKRTLYEQPAPYVPTTIESLSVARKYFREARYNPKESQCFNRAMVWSFEWWREHSLKSNKILIYFTRNYIRRYNFEWWFHIAPYVHVMDNDKVVERVMDRKYTSGPLDFQNWTNIFMRNNPECPVITQFSDYADYPYSGDCFIQRTNMYTYQPADLQMNEAWGYFKESFDIKEVTQAYLEAFDEILSK